MPLWMEIYWNYKITTRSVILAWNQYLRFGLFTKVIVSPILCVMCVCFFFHSDHSCKIDKNIMLNHAWQCKNNVQRIWKWLLNIRKHPIRVMLHKWFKTTSSGIDFSINQTPGSRLDRYLSIKKTIFILYNGHWDL